jgi:hypothetical protein
MSEHLTPGDISAGRPLSSVPISVRRHEAPRRVLAIIPRRAAIFSPVL